ncbi:4Fe-4S dicluster domain-containing protein [Sarcina sp. DSM 11001]|uniref:4Fe-4S dicluster domain-containing protein n=1 Tax=Sarcina sp. DSM 11001 TaxID=1798184 RepID=UPI0008851EFB|nr:4Fe-4S dicluster domain-containing protein [Sarcina sp. DSM 11001]SDL34893.1 4Fe-4S dicluster domain-containing protein [Sarcina sp. DSM 11001]
MGHLTSRDAYRNLEDRINWFTQGAAPSETLTKILRVLFTEKEAKWVAKLPIRPFTLKKAARLWGTTEAKAEKLLDHLCEKGLLVDSYDRGIRKFVLPPPMIGFFEFSLMRTRGDIDQKYLSELFYQYINVEEDFIKELFLGMDTKLGRVFVNEPVLMTEKTNHILDYERATHIIEDADFIGVGTCFCRHKNYHLGIPCKLNAPMETCLTFGNVARSLAEHGGYTRPIDKSEALEILEMSYGYNLVQMGENVRERPAFMCNCCGCCCEALEAVRRFAPMQPIATTNYLPKINPDECVSCGKCEKVCPILAISMQEREASVDKKKPVIDESICLGCGVCARNCPKKAITLQRRPVEVITPVNSTHRFVLQAIEKGTLQNLVFDNQAFANHRAMAAVFGTILRLPPLKQAMASRQFKSVYLDHLLAAQKKA